MNALPATFARRFRRLSLPVAGLALATWACAQLLPNAPIPNFHLPVFDAATGQKTSDLRGAEAIYHNRTLVELHEFTLVMLAPDGSTRMEVQSPKAMLHIPERSAQGDQSIRVQSPTYELTGHDWRWEEKDNHIVIRHNVRLTINAAVGSLLK